MVPIRRHAGDRRWHVAAGIALALIAAPVHGTPHVPTNRNAPPGQGQQGTSPPASPPVQIVQVEPSPKAIEQAAEAETAKRRVFGLEPDAWIAIFTLVLALCTAGLFGATLFLWSATKALAKSTEDLAVGAEDQARETKLSRQLAEKQHDLAEKQFLLAARECDLADKRHGLQRLQFMAEHRPRLKIRSIGIIREQGDFPVEPEKPIVGSLVIWNDGACDATILEANYRFFLTQQDLPMIPPLENEKVKPLIESDLPHMLIGHGSHLVPIDNAALGKAAEGIRDGVERLYVIGAIRYHGGDINMVDGTMRERWMGFCRKYVSPQRAGGDGRFVPVDNPDYEYSD